ncbi:hypothetical protein B9P90_27470 [Citrobacter freundii]|uniref:Uncharacterized protein n=1 Tax=Citrobacter freundii TaxID=546 RepID=A0AA44SHV0_CITFR|nr:hypothetical protein B9P90_27470 [Citrobacter freundii]OYQ93463.1 hypothetical protein B9P89_27635 [Citrobacter freundii]
MCWLLSFTPVTYSSKLLGIHSIAAFLQFELFRGSRSIMGLANSIPALPGFQVLHEHAVHRAVRTSDQARHPL